MRITANYFTSILAVGAAAVAIAAAPSALAIAAAPTAAAAAQSCTSLSGGFQGVQCQSPGNVQINDSPPAAQSSGPYGAYGPFFSYDRGRGHR
jgi:hypothetical protein